MTTENTIVSNDIKKTIPVNLLEWELYNKGIKIINSEFQLQEKDNLGQAEWSHSSVVRPLQVIAVIL